MDLHPILGVTNCTIEFRIARRGRFVRVDVPIETVAECFGVREEQHGLLLAYEAHRSSIDCAVLRRADDDSGADVIQVHSMDIRRPPQVPQMSGLRLVLVAERNETMWPPTGIESASPEAALSRCKL